MDTEPLTAASALIEQMEEALRRALSVGKACPYCDTPTYLRRHHPGCGLKKVLEEAQAWIETHR